MDEVHARFDISGKRNLSCRERALKIEALLDVGGALPGPSVVAAEKNSTVAIARANVVDKFLRGPVRDVAPPERGALHLPSAADQHQRDPEPIGKADARVDCGLGDGANSK
jgi:hypothetical protein